MSAEERFIGNDDDAIVLAARCHELCKYDLFTVPSLYLCIVCLSLVLETCKDRKSSKNHYGSDPYAYSSLVLHFFQLLFHLRISSSFVNLLSTLGLPLFITMLSSILTPNFFSMYIPGSTVTAIFALSSS